MLANAGAWVFVFLGIVPYMVVWKEKKICSIIMKIIIYIRRWRNIYEICNSIGGCF